jgi:hypothetical protein
MDSPIHETIEYTGGYLELTDTHLYVVRGKYRVGTMALRHISSVSAEEAQSFRHRVWGLVFGILFLLPAASMVLPGDIIGNLAVLGFFRGKLGIAVAFTALFGVLCLWGVFTSRRIWWLRIQYGRTLKLIPVPGVGQESIEQILGIINKVIGERP